MTDRLPDPDTAVHRDAAADLDSGDRAPRPGPAAATGGDLRRRLGIATGLGVPVVVLTAVPVLQFDYWQWLSLSLAAPAVTWGGWPFHRAAWHHLRRGEATTSALVSLSSLAGLAWSVWALFLGGAGAPATRQGLGLALARSPDGRPLYLAAAVVVTGGALAAWYLTATTSEARQPGHAPIAPIQLVARPRPSAGARRAGRRSFRELVGYLAERDTPRLELVGALAAVIAAGTLGFWLAASGDGAAAGAHAVAVVVLAYPVGLALATPLPLVLAAPRLRQLGMDVERPDAPAAARAVDTIVVRKHGTLTTGRLVMPAPRQAASDEAGRPTRLALADAVRPTASRAVAQLRALGVQPVLLTADLSATADPVAVVVGIDEVVAGVPASGTATARAIGELQRQGRVVAVMGHSPRDAAALAQADLGIACGAATDTIGVAHPSLERAELWTAVDAIRLGRAIDRIVRGNVALATVVSIAAMPLAASGRLSPAGLLVVMAAAAGSVAANSLRLRRFRRRRPPAHRRPPA